VEFNFSIAVATLLNETKSVEKIIALWNCWKFCHGNCQKFSSKKTVLSLFFLWCKYWVLTTNRNLCKLLN